jgi:precorrin-3B C17-methyltransferase
MSECNGCSRQGILRVVGIGPGDPEMRTSECTDAIINSDIIVGYKTYIALVHDIIIDKKVDSSGMHDEVERVERAVFYVKQGFNVALISSGDPGVYGMAGLTLEICSHKNLDIDIRVYSGITAANSAAALLGAPLSCDYCVLSLSDLLISQQTIINRAYNAASGDFVTVLYNPVSRKREQLIKHVQQIFLDHRKKDTPVGIVRNIGRNDQSVMIRQLDDFTEYTSDMVTTVVIGNSQTYTWKNRMINPRGYMS